MEVVKAEVISDIYTADQTAANFELLPCTTIDSTGAKTILVRCGKLKKDRVTVMLLGDSNGTKYPLFLVMKAAPSKSVAIQDETKKLRHGFGRRLWQDVEQLQRDYSAQIYASRSA